MKNTLAPLLCQCISTGVPFVALFRVEGEYTRLVMVRCKANFRGSQSSAYRE